MSDAILNLTVEIVSAHVRRQGVPADQLPELIRTVFAAFLHVGQPAPNHVRKEPAVPVKKSVFDDHIICLECGKDFRTLKLHLYRRHGLTTDEYRHQFALPRDYPLVAPAYTEARADIAKSLGLGRRGRGARKAGGKRM